MTKFITFFLLLLSIFTFSQKTVTGIVKEAGGDPIPSASITVEEPGKDAIIAYAISNSKGEYKITFTSSEPTVELKIKAFNHKSQVKNIKNDSQNLSIVLDSEATEIKEVKLKTKLITKRGDTISYDLKAFDSKADRTVADVLKKIPGIEVNKDGTVLYQGEAINKFYVNGKDLMEGGYGTINNSMPKDAVQKVEVLENHQPVKMLQDKVPSEQAALNIVLKNKVTMTGRGEVGVGMSPFLWNLKLTPMFFGQKNQWVVNYKTNNNGESVENEGNMLAFGNRWEGRRVQAGQTDWLNVENAGTPSLPEKRYLMNNVHFLSANILTNPFKNKEWELKANANYTNNFINRTSESTNRDLQFNKTYFINIYNKFFTDKAKGELIFTKNAKKGFFKNTTTFSQFWNADRAAVNRQDALGLRNGSESIESPTTNFQNSMSAIIPWKEKMVNVQSYLHYQTDRQTLDVAPAGYMMIPTQIDSMKTTYFGWQNADRVIQNFNMKTFEANHSANISFIKGGWTFTPEVGLNYQSNKMKSDMYGDSAGNRISYGDSFVNDINFTNTVPYASLGINYKSEAWSLYSNLPFNFNHIKAEDIFRNQTKSYNKMSFTPNFFAQYSFASFWKASANASMNYSFADINDVYAGQILTAPGNFSVMPFSNPFVENRTTSAGTRIEYRNPLNNLFFNVGYRKGWSNRNLTANSITDGNGLAKIEYIDREYKTENDNLSAEIGKYFPKYKTNMSVGYGNTHSQASPMRNNRVIETKNSGQNINFKFNNTYFEWMSVDYNLAYSWNKQKTDGIATIPSTGFTHNLAAYFYPIENHTIGFFWDQINSGNKNQMYHNAFYDISYQYTWSKKKIDFELKWLNIANKKVFERYTLSAFNESYTKMQLRPSQFMFTVKFNFK